MPKMPALCQEETFRAADHVTRWNFDARRSIAQSAASIGCGEHMRSVQLAADTPLTTSRGATFTSPAGWTVTSAPNKLVLDAPEGDSRLALVDVEAADAAAA